MTLLMNQLQMETTDTSEVAEANAISNDRMEELTILMESIHEQNSPMAEELRMQKQASADSLDALFFQTVRRKGEEEKLQANWISETEMEVEGISEMTLHSFLLKAEQLGKKITYTRTLRVKISDQ